MGSIFSIHEISFSKNIIMTFGTKLSLGMLDQNFQSYVSSFQLRWAVLRSCLHWSKVNTHFYCTASVAMSQCYARFKFSITLLRKHSLILFSSLIESLSQSPLMNFVLVLSWLLHHVWFFFLDSTYAFCERFLEILTTYPSDCY